jgi:hypothetical protein
VADVPSGLSLTPPQETKRNWAKSRTEDLPSTSMEYYRYCFLLGSVLSHPAPLGCTSCLTRQLTNHRKGSSAFYTYLSFSVLCLVSYFLCCQKQQVFMRLFEPERQEAATGLRRSNEKGTFPTLRQISLG